MLVAVAATSSHGATVTPGKQAELPMDTSTLPDDCRAFLAVIPDLRSDLVPWYQKLSVAACRQRMETTPATTPQQLGPLVKGLESQMAPSIAIYTDAAARGPAQIPIVSQYWIGMTYLNIAVRARRAVDAGASVGGATYGGWSDGAMGLHRALEPLIARDLQNAVVAFHQVEKLAAADPAAACADPVVSQNVEQARVMLKMLPHPTETGGTSST
jgi:hypothetical protein